MHENMSRNELEGRSALVTGASGAIGSAIAKKLSSLGANLILTGTNQKKIDNLKKELGKNTIGVTANLLKDKEIENLYEESIKKFKSIDILINNAGTNKDALSIRMTKEQWNEVININLSATFKLSQLAIKSMIKQKWGRIIGISSIIGVGGNIGQANYAASKAGLIQLTQALALEWAKNQIRVNAIAPGYVLTEMNQEFFEKNSSASESIVRNIPQRRIGTPEELTGALLLLASDASSYMTGSTIVVDGGHMQASL